jgi:hypothetical protein
LSKATKIDSKATTIEFGGEETEDFAGLQGDEWEIFLKRRIWVCASLQQ